MTISSKEVYQILKLLQGITANEKEHVLKLLTSDPQALGCSPTRVACSQESTMPTAT